VRPKSDGTVTACQDRNICDFTVTRGEYLRALVSPENSEDALAAPGGDIVASGDNDGGLGVWDTSDGA
jgi:WD40 repeat protein